MYIYIFIYIYRFIYINIYNTTTLYQVNISSVLSQESEVHNKA